jgi:hypothetical protein
MGVIGLKKYMKYGRRPANAKHLQGGQNVIYNWNVLGFSPQAAIATKTSTRL